MKSKKKILLIAAILILTVVSIGTYAIYKSTATGTSGFKTAKWYIELNGEDITTSNTFTFDLKDADWTHDAVIDSDEQDLVVISPGSYGSFGINIDASETEVDVEYTLTAVVKQNDTVVDLSTINPNLSLGFYENDELKSNTLTGSIDAHGTYNGEIRITWNEVDSSESNSNDININDQDFVVEVTIETKQKEKPNPVIYPEGKTKATVMVGDIVKIGTEEFYVVKHDGNDLVLFSHYNLNVGSNKKASVPEGMQDSEIKGWILSGRLYGNLTFASTNYWDGKVGTDYPGTYCSSHTYTPGTNCAYVYDANSNLKTFVDAYKTALEEMGATIKEARLLRVEEAYELGCGNGEWNCDNAPSFVTETSYWLGSANGSIGIWYVRTNGRFGINNYNSDSYYCGVRPVIII